MKTPMPRSLINNSTLAAITSAVLALGLVTTAANAQKTPAAAATPTNAQLQEENRALRMEIDQLKKNAQMPADASGKPKCCMDKNGKPMGKPGMGMDKMDKMKDDSMGMPPAGKDAPKDPPMGHE